MAGATGLEEIVKNFISAIVAVVCLFVIVNSAIAQDDAVAKQKAVEFCEMRYAGESSAKQLQQVLCIHDQNILILQARIKNGEIGLAEEVAKPREELKTTRTELAKVERDATAPPPSIPPLEGGRDESRPATPLNPHSGMGEGRVPATRPTAFVGVPHSVVQAPGQYAAATFDPGGPRLNLQSLGWGADKHAHGATQVRVVVKKNGAPIPVAHADRDRPWNQFYADLDGDGQPDSRPYKGLDPRSHNDVYISMVSPRDRIELVWIVDTGKRVLIPGLPPQILWGNGKRVEYDPPDRIGSWRQSSHGGWPLN